MDVIGDTLNELREQGLLRSLRRRTSPDGRVIELDGKEYLSFSSNNYLGLATHPRMKRAAAEAAQKYGTGNNASRLISGNLALYEELEAGIARLKSEESALVFPTGFMANYGTITALFGPEDFIAFDRLSHASIIDGVLASKARFKSYPHRDLGRLAHILEKAGDARTVGILTDSVFSMDGTLAPMKELSALANKHGALLMVDEAHATGVFGARGGGIVEEAGLEGGVDIVMGTFSKALGSLGGFICARPELRELLLNRARAFIFTTALPPPVLAASIEAVKIVEEEPERRQKLLAMSAALREKLRALGLDTLGTESQIIPVVAGSSSAALAASARLLEEGIFLPAVRPPTVKEGTARLRISLMATHTEEDISRLASSLASVKNGLF